MFRHILPNLYVVGGNVPAARVLTQNGLYVVTPVMLPDVANRFNAYRRTPVRWRLPQLDFRPDDVISFYFDPNPVGNRHAAPIQYQNDINAYLDNLGLPARANGTVNMFLTNVQGAAHGEVILGGLAQMMYAFNVRPNIDLEAFLEAMEERMYHGFEIHHVGIRVDISLTDFVRATLRGGSDILGLVPDMPKSKYPLELCEVWPSAFLGAYHRRYREAAPTHLSRVKGLLLYKWNYQWRNHCAVMAIVYGVALLKLQAKLVGYVRHTEDIQPPASQRRGNQGIMSALLDTSSCDYAVIRPEIEECQRLHNGQQLYDEAERVMSTKTRVSEFPSHFQLGAFFDICYPEYTLVVVDESRHILYMRCGSECPTDPPESGYNAERRPLTWHDINETKSRRVYIYYDHVLQHYFPIYNLERFLTRNAVHMEVTMKHNPPVPVPELKKSNDRRMTFCPFCDAGIASGYIGSHTCNILRCYLCDAVFTNATDRIAHMNPTSRSTTTQCRRCKGKCYGWECLRKHQAACNGTSYIQCQLCFQEVASYRAPYHRCTTYYCHGCKNSVRNKIQYNHRDYPGGYIQYHACSMPGKEDMTKRLAVESKQSEQKNALFFAFDFESMLTLTAYQKITIHIHTVNCVSSAEIALQAGAAQPRVWTQYTLDDFWAHIQRRSTCTRNFWIAHNFKGYDGRLLFDYFQSKNIIPDQMLWQGGKIMQMQLQHPQHMDRSIVFQDSLSHIATTLACMPKMFGLDPNIVKKGYFPYLFNTPEHQDYSGPIPPLAYFNYENQYDKKAFMKWYNEWLESDKPYNLKQEMTEYCENDTLVLSLSLSSYARICLEYSRVNPLPYLTIAQFTFMHYRMMHMPTQTVYYLDESYDTFARHALHGGNTNVRRLLYECSQEEAGTLAFGEKGLRYIDVQSLYPTVQYYDPMPVGFPVTSIFHGGTDQPSENMLRTFFGFIECDIEPVRYMEHPLLGRFAHNRLYMDLHPHKKIVITSAEFQMAVSERGGYRCTHVYRVDQYKKSHTLFQSFIRNWLRLKIISGKPPYAVDTPEFESYREQLAERLQITIQAEDFVYNPSLRTLAKLVLNSLWGKFGQRTNLMECRILKTANDMYNYHQLRRMGIIKHSSDASLGTIAHMKRCESLAKWNKKNVAIASFVTAHARLRLWDVMEQLGDRVLYHDTDSVIYERRSSADMMIEEGCFLGQWESETGDAMIHSFVGLAPKTYAFRYFDTDKQQVVEQIKSKGFSLKPNTTAILNYDSYRALAMAVREHGLGTTPDTQDSTASQEETNPTSLKVPSHFFRHHPEYGMTYTCEGYKVLSFDYQKGFVDYTTWRTYPYGSQNFIENPFFLQQPDGVLNGDMNKEDREVVEMLCSLDFDEDTDQD